MTIIFPPNNYLSEMNRSFTPQSKPGLIRPITVLGMHRSGTSCLTGLLEDAGVWLGPVSKHAPFNLKGNQENSEIVALHDDVLADNGAQWDRPPMHASQWQAQRIGTLGRILERYPKDKPWAFKDPRSCFTIGAWKQALPQLQFIGTYRHPVAVAMSLHQRNGMAMERGVELWLRYNRQLIDLKERFGFRLVCFDLDPAAYLEQVAYLFQGLGLTFPPSALSFFDAGLRKQTPNPSATLPSVATDLYRYLSDLSG